MGVDIVKCAPLARCCLRHYFYFFTELVDLEWIVLLLSRVPAERTFLLLLVVNLLKLAALYLELELLTEA
jgi:hypothetical protein